MAAVVIAMTKHNKLAKQLLWMISMYHCSLCWNFECFDLLSEKEKLLFLADSKTSYMLQFHQ